METARRTFRDLPLATLDRFATLALVAGDDAATAEIRAEIARRERAALRAAEERRAGKIAA